MTQRIQEIKILVISSKTDIANQDELEQSASNTESAGIEI